MHYFNQMNLWYLGVILSIFFGCLSYHLIESRQFINYNHWRQLFHIKPVWLTLIMGGAGLTIFTLHGLPERYPAEFHQVIAEAKPSPFRKQCHISKYREPSESCEYFEDNVSWAILGDSHTVEIAYALAEKLRDKGTGLKHFSFSACIPSYTQQQEFSPCAQWYNDSLSYILENKDITDVVLNHRYTSGFHTNDIDQVISSLDQAILKLAESKQRIFVYYPIPELNNAIHELVGRSFQQGNSLKAIKASTLKHHLNHHAHIINHFEQTDYPNNVYFIRSEKAFCQSEFCYSVINNKPLYFDDHHPSIAGATRLVALIPDI